MLGIFITVGVCIWGFDVTKAAKEVHESSDKRDRFRSSWARPKRMTTEIQETRPPKKRFSPPAAKSTPTRQKHGTCSSTHKIWSSRSRKKSNKPRSFSRGSSNAAERPTSQAPASRCQNWPGSTTFRPNLDGSGQTIGIIELGGGYREADLDAYFADLKLPRPKVTSVSVLGAQNMPGSGPDDFDEMVTMNLRSRRRRLRRGAAHRRLFRADRSATVSSKRSGPRCKTRRIIPRCC